jgi:hypothetical protein
VEGRFSPKIGDDGPVVGGLPRIENTIRGARRKFTKSGIGF